MTYKEFEEWAEGEGYDVKTDQGYVRVYDKWCPLSIVGTYDHLDISTDFPAFDRLSDKNKNNLFKKLVKLTETPLEDREEPKRYKLRHTWIGEDGLNYLNASPEGGYVLNGPFNGGTYQTVFTEEEIRVIQQNYLTDLFEFEMIEVE